MRKLITMVAATLVIGSAAMAQTAGTAPGSAQTKPLVPEAPVGHRQPHADQVPSEKNLSNPKDPVNREDALLDKKIKSICRGC
jgi:hypothetical protein